MARYSGRRTSGRKPQRRGLTIAQQAAHDKAWAACDHSFSGRSSKGSLVSDYFQRECWKVVTYGIACHEDVTSRIYGVQPARGPAGWKECVEIRAAIRAVMEHGTNEPGSRAGGDQVARPAGEKLAAWQDKCHGSYAICETITVYEGAVVGVCSPNYDDSPTTKWLRDPQLAKRLLKAIEKCPQAITLPEANVTERTMRLTIDESHPRFAAYMAARAAKFEPHDERYAGIRARVTLPISEWRRIKAELDAAGAE